METKLFGTSLEAATEVESHESFKLGEAVSSTDGIFSSEEELIVSPCGSTQRQAAMDPRRRIISALALAVVVALGIFGALEAAWSSQNSQARSQLQAGINSTLIDLSASSSSPQRNNLAVRGADGATWDAATTDDDGECPICAPEIPTSPDLVIPFFERDLCKLKTTAKSLSVNDPNGMFGDVYLLWVSTKHSSEFSEELREAAEAIAATHSVQLIEFTDLMEYTDSLSGWHAQQILKLKAASLVKAPYYVVMDSKNTLIRPVKPDDLFTKCNTARIQAQYTADKIPMPHIDWYNASAEALGMDPPSEGYWPASITPVVFHTQTVLDMLEHIGEGSGIDALCDGPLCEMFGARDDSGKGATEFTMYTLWAMSRSNFECVHSVQKLDHFKLAYSQSWEEDLNRKLNEHGWDAGSVTIGNTDSVKPFSWLPGTTENVPNESQFPISVEDLSKRWAASLWRGMPEQAEFLAEVNHVTLEDVIGGRRQKPFMFGAQPASLEDLPSEKKKLLTDLLVKLYTQAGLYDFGAPDELVECVVGLHN
jgi:hypothetical protein